MQRPEMLEMRWSQFLAALDAERAALPPVRPIRAMAEDFVLRTLTLLFPSLRPPNAWP